MNKGIIVGTFLATVVAIILVAVVLVNPFKPSFSASVNLTITNYTHERQAEVYADGHYAAEGILGPLDYTTFTFDVTWKGNSTNECLIEVFSEGARWTTTVWLTEDMEAQASITII